MARIHHERTNSTLRRARGRKEYRDDELLFEACERRLGDVPIIYAVAQVCRPDLLVEIECVAVAN